MVADAAFGAKVRRVRCGKCKHEWLAEPTAESISAAPAPQIEIRPIPSGSNVPAIPTDTKKIAKQVGIGVLALSAILLGGWLLMTAVLGDFMFKAGEGTVELTLSDIATRYDDNSKGGYALVVEGSIKNNSSDDVVVPSVRVIIKNAAGEAVNTGTANVQRAELLGNDLTSFVYTLDPVPDDISDVTVEFASPDGSTETQP